MNRVIEEIIDEIKKETGMSKYDIEKIIDSQYKSIQIAIEERDLRTINLIHLGKIKPSKWLISNHEFTKGDKRYFARVDESLNQ